MPDFRLSEEDAGDIAAYLKAGPDLVLPENLTKALTRGDAFSLDQNLVERGKELFASKRCNACHMTPGGGARVMGRAAALVELEPDSRNGCLSARPVSGGIPFFGLDEVQKRAITAALERLPSRQPLEASGRIDWMMKVLNCYACHERDGAGGPETAREVYFGFEGKGAVDLGRFGHLPPSLTQVGGRLESDWILQVLVGEETVEKARPYLAARMPSYMRAHAQPLADLVIEIDSNSSEGIDPRSPGIKEGEMLVGPKGKDCRRCHPIGERPSTGLPGINLSLAPQRLQYSHFRELLLNPEAFLPGSGMPDQFGEGKEAEGKIRAIWEFLESSGSN